MPTEPPNHSHETDDERPRRSKIPASALRVGDAVVWTSKFNKRYHYEVAEVDST
jgi:lambda repressor-like predicted transcriptional regulator